MKANWKLGGIASLLIAGASNAQQLVCTASDASCFDRELEKACLRVGATIASCAEWLNILEHSPLSRHPNVRVAAAETNLILNDLSGGRGSNTKYRDQAELILDELIIDDPNNVKALFALAAMRERKEERVELLRRVVAVDPTFVLGWTSLAAAVSSGGAKPDLQESAEFLEQAYVASPSGPRKWHLAADAIMQYENAQSAIDARRLSERASADYGLDRLLTVVSKPETVGPATVNAALEELCSNTGVVIFGARHCLDSIQSVVNVANTTRNTAVESAYAEGATTAMRNAAVSLRLSSVDPGWRARFEKTIGGFLESPTATEGMFVAYADITTDSEKRLQALETAAGRFPSDGDIVTRLGLAYLDQGRKDDGIRTLGRAKELVPPTRHAMIDQAVNQASAR